MSESRQESQFALLIATDAGYDPIIRAAMATRGDTLVLFGTDAEFPFRPRPSTILVPHMPAGVIACIPALEEFGIASRLASTAGSPGCYDGPVIELAQLWLSALAPELRAQVQITVSGPASTVAAAELLGERFDVPVMSIAMLF